MKVTRGMTPFPYVVVDEHFDPILCREAADEFPSVVDPRWHWFNNPKEYKAQSTDYQMISIQARELIAYMMSPAWISNVERMFGIDGLIPDTTGGGLHYVPPGGHLAVHADFNRSPSGSYRRVNCLLYLNAGWNPEWGGALELHPNDPDGDTVVIDPLLGRCVLFETSSTSFHGHPRPTLAPVGRKSIAVYYYTREAPAGAHEPHSTIFKD